MNYKISIIIPCFNEEKTIEKIVTEVLKQKDLIYEIIIVDDMSTDLSRKKIKALADGRDIINYIFKDKNEEKALHFARI